MVEQRTSNLLSRLKAIAEGGVDFDCEITEHTRKEIVEAETVAGLALAEIERLRAALAESEQTLDEWYRTEARLHALIHVHGGGDAIRAAIAELGVSPTAHNPRLADETGDEHAT